jgi:hypothetical protein
MSEPTYFAKVVDNIVEGVYVADAEWVNSQDGVWIQSTETNKAYQGATVVDGVFIQPVISEE